MVRKIIRRKKKKMNTKMAVLVSLFMLTSYGAAYTVDGSLSDWGVTPFTDWIPDSPTAEYSVENFNGSNYEPGPVYPNPYGGETFDIEALYFDDTVGTAYIASVVSMGPTGYAGYIMGDFAIDEDGDGIYEYGVKVTGPNKGQVCFNPVWKFPHTIPVNGPSYFYCNGSNSIVKGQADVKYIDANITDNNVHNWIIEAAIPKVLIGLPVQNEINYLHITQSCGNDAINLIIDWDYQLPEFVSVGVPLLVLILAPALAFVLVRRRKQ